MLYHDNNSLAPLLEDLKKNDRDALLFYPIFIIRRLLVSLTIVILSGSPAAQIVIMLNLCLAMILYMIIVKPFDNTTAN